MKTKSGFDPVTIIPIIKAAVPIVDSFIDIFSSRMKCPRNIKIDSVNYGYTESWDELKSTWMVGYQNAYNGEWLMVTENIHDKRRNARREFKKAFYGK